MLFGSQDYSDNSHKTAFSPSSIVKLFNEAGFRDVRTQPHPHCATDMLVMAKAPKIGPNIWTAEQRRAAYDKRYFNGGTGDVGGYAREGYWDYPVHWVTFNHVLALKPESVLEIGCARGYILKRLEDVGITVKGLEVSQHCYLTRVTNAVQTWDITNTPWPIANKQYDLCISMAVLEHIPADKLPAVMAEIERCTKRGLHGIDFGDADDGFDKTHCTLQSKEWWADVLPAGQIGVDKESLERDAGGPPGPDGLLKLNIGSFNVMFHSGWNNIDIAPLQDYAANYGYLFTQCDVRMIDKILTDNSVDLIYTSHFLEHLTYGEGEVFLKECFKAMKPGAIMRIAVPDVKKLARHYLDGELDYFDEVNDTSAGSKAQAAKFWALIAGGHFAFYDDEALIQMLQGVGFGTKRMAFRESASHKMLSETLDMFPEQSLYVEAVK